MNKQFQYGKYLYDYVLKLEPRKTLSLTVTPERKLIVKAPPKADEIRIEKFLQHKWVWLEKQVQYFSKFKKRLYTREYISGESFFYLGRQYQLIVRHGKNIGVSLKRGKLLLTTSTDVLNGDVNKRILNAWFRIKTKEKFNERLDIVFAKFNYTKRPNLSFKKMNKRWGSFASNERVILNSELIHASKECIDYVITHELCHFRYKRHSRAFYRLLSQKNPGWEKVKTVLEERYLE